MHARFVTRISVARERQNQNIKAKKNGRRDPNPDLPREMSESKSNKRGSNVCLYTIPDLKGGREVWVII